MEKPNSEKIIIDAALKVFSAKGYANTRIADIAKETGMSYGLVYHYFGTKEKLFDIIMEDWWNGFYDALEILKHSALTTEENLIGIIRYILGVYEMNPNQLSIFVTEVCRGFVYHNDPKGKDKFRKLFAFCQDIMLEGQHKGILRTDIQPIYLAYLFLGAIDTFLSILILSNETLTLGRQNRFTEAIISVFLNGAAFRITPPFYPTAPSLSYEGLP